MAATKKPLRFAHSEGHTDLCYNDPGSHIFTCGADGDVRVWAGIEDDDAESYRVGDKAFAVAFKDKHFYAATESNVIQAHTFPDGNPDGTIARFTSPVTQICINKDGTKLVAGASDFAIKLVYIANKEFKTFEGHDAPILSIALDPKEEYLASSSCDGTVKVWRLADQSCLKTMHLLPKYSDISLSKGLCRMDWEPKSGRYLAIPTDKEIRLYERDTWDNLRFYADTSIKTEISITTFSPCGKYLAAATYDGGIFIWCTETRKCLLRDRHPKNLTICALKWNPKGNQEIAFCDTEGQFGILEDIRFDSENNEDEAEEGLTAEQYASLFAEDDDDDDNMVIPSLSKGKKVVNADGEDDDDDDASSVVSLQRLKQKYLPEDENSMDVDSLFKAPEDEADNVSEPVIEEKVKTVVVDGYKPTPLQRPFQPASTSAGLSQRFMVWNSVGVIRQYSTNEENSIDIEFHDTATHHAMHMSNDLGHSMADMSKEAVILACVSDDETLSKLVCLHFSSWDNSRDWSISMPKGEEIQCITLGSGWIAVGTDKRHVRIFTISGIQCQIFSTPGPIVTLAAHGNQLMTVFHIGQGVPGDQNLGVKLLQISRLASKPLPIGEGLPISPKSTLSWIGFSAERTPFTVDSAGVVRMLNRKFGLTWIQVANFKDHTKNRSDSYWLVDVLENPAQLRCILCKGSTFPTMLPRPVVQILPFQIPLCELETEKSRLEETYCKSQLFSSHLDRWMSLGLDEEMVTMRKSSAETTDRECLMKMFALACKSDREFRATEICDLMPDQQTVQLAIKYASRLRHLMLAQRISEIAKRKGEEEEARLFGDAHANDDDDENFRTGIDNQHNTVDSEWSSRNGYGKGLSNEEEENENLEDTMEEEEIKSAPMLMVKEKKPELKPTLSQISRKNPFKMSQPKESATRGTSVFDNMKPEKKAASKNIFGKPSEPLIVHKKMIKKKPSAQMTIFSSKAKDKTASEVNASDTEKKKPISAFQLWLDENRPSLEEEHPHLSADDLTKLAARSFRQLTKDERKEWMDKAKSMNSTEEDTKKRKREDNDMENKEIETEIVDDQPKKKSKDSLSEPKEPLSQRVNSKLSGFAFDKR
ncbi:WD repeat and HMG-box DNA-binding protein 1-like [Tubulanus polymorphus]|uniref:WD repeat and HMG-box DNA-binding protein 1-like n=1 Tax=Tubulanus polymorphus TaxID=672921 RepID=UPI003DA29A48